MVYHDVITIREKNLEHRNDRTRYLNFVIPWGVHTKNLPPLRYFRSHIQLREEYLFFLTGDSFQADLADTEAKIIDRLGREVLPGWTDSSGRFSAELLEYQVSGAEKTILSPYTVTVGGKSREVTLNKNLAITLKSR